MVACVEWLSLDDSFSVILLRKNEVDCNTVSAWRILRKKASRDEKAVGLFYRVEGF